MVRVILTLYFSKVTKTLLAALNSFPGKQEKQGGDSASEDEGPSSASEPQGREVPDTTQGCSRLWKSSRIRRTIAREVWLLSVYRIKDPQGSAEKLLKHQEYPKEDFEVRRMLRVLAPRLAGIHRLSFLTLLTLCRGFCRLFKEK